MHALPEASPWFRVRSVNHEISQIDEPHVDDLLRGNVWHVRGRRDLVVDAGLGVASLRAELPGLFDNDPLLVVTHAHLDHMGSAHEFSERWSHRLEDLHAPVGNTIVGSTLADQLGLSVERYGPLPQLLLTARPHPTFDAVRHRLVPAPATGFLADGDLVDLGDRQFVALHLPGHTPGSLALFEGATGSLFSGDVIYDDILLDDLHGANTRDYASSLTRLLNMPIDVVYPGHGDPFDAARMREIIEAQLATWKQAPDMPHDSGP